MRARLAVATTLALLAAAAPARAATVELTGSTGPSSSGILVYAATGAERNRVQVDTRGYRTVIVDRGTQRIRLTKSARFDCRVTSRQRVVCDSGDISTVSLELGAGDDSATFVPGTDSTRRPTDPLLLAEDYEDYEGEIQEEAWIQGGPGDDRLSGTRYDDFIAPGPGADRVEGRAGLDRVSLEPDGRRDVVLGGGDADAIGFYRARVPVTVDLAARTAGVPGDLDVLRGIERVHGGAGDDTLLGSDAPDALYGERGSDLVDGRGGGDLVVGDSPLQAGSGFANRLVGGEGDDLLDAHSDVFAPTSTLSCGPGTDLTAAGGDDLVGDSCESVQPGETGAHPFFRRSLKPHPVARGAQGEYFFEYQCPKRTGGCRGTIALESPPEQGRGEPPESYGGGTIDAASGEPDFVAVTLTPAGRAAVGAGAPVTVDVSAEIAPREPGGPSATAGHAWQVVLAP